MLRERRPPVVGPAEASPVIPIAYAGAFACARGTTPDWDNRRMRAARLIGPGRVECVEAPVPEPAEGEILVRTLSASVCGSDLRIIYNGLWSPAYPCPCGYPGHESVGRVLESRHDDFEPGDQVLLVPPPHTSAAYADYQTVAGASAIALRPDEDPARLVIAQQLGTVIFALNRFWPEDERGGVATVIGAGSAGLMFTWLLARAGFDKVVVSDLMPARLEHARRLGADVTVQVPEASAVEATLEASDGAGADVVIDASGYDDGRIDALRSVRVGGRVGLFGLPERPGLAPFPVEEIFTRIPTVLASRAAQLEPGLVAFRRAVELIRDGGFDAGAMVTHTLGIERIADALDIAHDRADGAIKVSIDFA